MRKPKPIPADLAAELMPVILRDIRVDPDGCWTRFRRVNPSTGYTAITPARSRSTYLAHRVTYTYKNGPIPEELEIDHLCRNRACCNPDHLEAVTHRDNIMRSPANPFAINARKTHCQYGHPLVEVSPGSRQCATCVRVNRKRKREERRQQGVPADESHGTRRSYHWWSCRCELCREWQHMEYVTRKARA